MKARVITLCAVAARTLVMASFAHAGGYADPDYPQTSHSTMSRDAVSSDAARANNGIHSTEVLESQPAQAVTGADRNQVQAEATRANNGIHPTEVMESQVAPPVGSANPPGTATASGD